MDNKIEKKYSFNNQGLIIAVLIIIVWALLIFYNLNQTINYKNPITYLTFFLQIHLFTGLFITAHDSMHNSLSTNRFINDFIGKLCLNLFVFNSYKLLKPKHFSHHRYVATNDDPDYYDGNFFIWYYSFLKHYISLKQIILAAILFNVLCLFFNRENVLIYWALPSILSTFQLFYFGTYIPHKGLHDKDNFHKSHTLKKNHLYAFISCYFFGYHYEHHDSPKTPWWGLYRLK